MYYNLAILSYTASLFFTAFTVLNQNQVTVTFLGYECLFLCLFGVFGLNPYCWSNLFFIVWVGEAVSKKRKKLCLIYSIAAILGAFSFLLVSEFPLSEAGGCYGPIQSYGLGYYLWCSSFIFSFLETRTLQDDKQNAHENQTPQTLVTPVDTQQ